MPFGNPLGYGLMQPGGSFGGPLGLQRLRDPRYAYAQALLKGGTDTSPIDSPWQGLARLAQAGTSALLFNKANKDWDNRESNRALAIANALRDASGTPAETKQYGDGTTINWNPVAPNMQRAISGLAANPDTADMAWQFGMQEQQYQRGRADKKEDTAVAQNFQMDMQRAQQNFAASQAELTRAQQAALQNSSQANQAALQQAQQNFTAAQNDMNRALESQKIAAQQGSQGFERANKLRDEYSNLTKDFRVVQDAYSKIKSTSDTGPGDMSLLYSYVKLLDPGSVVRESEFGTAAASGSFGERIQGAVQRVLTGERLPASLREGFKAEAESLYKAQKAGADRLRSQYEELAGRYGLKKEDVIQDYAETPSAAAMKPEDSAALAWANANPTDPRAAAIKQKLGVK